MDGVLLALIAVSSVGWVVFAVGFVWNGITTPKRWMSTEEAAEFVEHPTPDRTGDVLARRSFRRSWFRGRAWGFSWFDEMSFGDLKAALQHSGMRGSTRSQQFALAVGGFVVGLFGLVLLIGWEVGTIGFVVAIAIVVYVAFQLTRAFVRA